IPTKHSRPPSIEFKADAPHRFNIAIAASVQLISQVANVHVNGFIPIPVGLAPDAFVNIGTAEHLMGMFEKQQQNGVLPPGQMDGLAVDDRFARLDGDSDITVVKLLRVAQGTWRRMTQLNA